MAHRRLPQAIDVIGRRRWKAALYNHAVALPGAPVTGRAIDVEALASTLQHLPRDRIGKSGYQVGPHFAGIKRLVLIEMSPGHGVWHQRTRGHVVILKKIAVRQRFAD